VPAQKTLLTIKEPVDLYLFKLKRAYSSHPQGLRVALLISNFSHITLVSRKPPASSPIFFVFALLAGIFAH